MFKVTSFKIPGQSSSQAEFAGFHWAWWSGYQVCLWILSSVTFNFPSLYMTKSLVIWRFWQEHSLFLWLVTVRKLFADSAYGVVCQSQLNQSRWSESFLWHPVILLRSGIEFYMGSRWPFTCWILGPNAVAVFISGRGRSGGGFPCCRRHGMLPDFLFKVTFLLDSVQVWFWWLCSTVMGLYGLSCSPSFFSTCPVFHRGHLNNGCFLFWPFFCLALQLWVQAFTPCTHSS